MFFLVFLSLFFFFNDTATTEIYTLSLHDALPIQDRQPARPDLQHAWPVRRLPPLDRKSTRLNSSHMSISYAVFCLKKKNKQQPRLSIKRRKIMSRILNLEIPTA